MLSPTFFVRLRAEFCEYLETRPWPPEQLKKNTKATYVWRPSTSPHAVYSTMTAGYVAVQMALSGCSQVTLYGFDVTHNCPSGSSKDRERLQKDCLRDRAAEETRDHFQANLTIGLPKHNFMLEHSIYRHLERRGLLEIRS